MMRKQDGAMAAAAAASYDGGGGRGGLVPDAADEGLAEGAADGVGAGEDNHVLEGEVLGGEQVGEFLRRG